MPLEMHFGRHRPPYSSVYTPARKIGELRSWVIIYVFVAHLSLCIFQNFLRRHALAGGNLLQYRKAGRLVCFPLPSILAYTFCIFATFPFSRAMAERPHYPPK